MKKIYKIILLKSIEFLTIKADEFINKVENNIYTDAQIDDICKFDEKEESSEESGKEKENLYFTLMIVFSATTGVFLILTIFFIIKATRSKTSESITKEGLLLKNYED